MSDESKQENVLDAIVSSAQSTPNANQSDIDEDHDRHYLDYDAEEKQQNLDFRKSFAGCVRNITVCWLIFIALMFLTSGIINSCGRMFLSDSVLIALITSTSLGVIIGMISIILRYLFPRK